jgi:hypothetical protein
MSDQVCCCSGRKTGLRRSPSTVTPKGPVRGLPMSAVALSITK